MACSKLCWRGGQVMTPQEDQRLRSSTISEVHNATGTGALHRRVSRVFLSRKESLLLSTIPWLVVLLFFLSKSHAESPFFGLPSIDIRHNGPGLWASSLGQDPTANDITAELPLTTGRARVVVDNIESDFLLDILEGRKFGRKDQKSEIASVSRINLERTSNCDLQLAWSEPSSFVEFHEDWLDELARNQKASPYATMVNSKAFAKSRFTSTGTTIVGVAGPDWCVLAADSRATSGTMVADKTCFKLHPLASNCAAAGAGTSADLDHITRECCYAARLMQQSVEHGNMPRTISTEATTRTVANNGSTISSPITTPPISVLHLCQYMSDRLYRQGGSCQANLIVGGVYNGRSVLRAIHPHGSMDVVSYTALGSGGLAAMGILESRWGSNRTGDLSSMTIDEATALAVEAVKAGIVHDMGSGSQVDVCIIGPDGLAKYRRGILPEESLNSLAEDEQADRSANAKEAAVVVDAHGVNGFGNLPYAIRSRRIIQKSRENQERLQEMRWDSILGS